MNFRTEIEKTNPNFLLSYHHQILALGSCFADTIGKKLQKGHFKIAVNPFGTIFNPYSIFKILDNVMDFILFQKQIINHEEVDNYIVQKNGMFVHLDYHSDISAETPEILHEEIIKKTEEIALFLQKTDVLMFTFGTSWVYKYKSLDTIVTNCHHLAQKEFDKYLLTIPEIVQYFDIFFEKIKKINPNIQTILTLSPVRHQKDSLTLNQISKSILRCAIHELCEKYNQNITYIPAYEILIDDLRDYRFYEDDLIHPNITAQNYIWDYFQKYFLDKKTQVFLEEWEVLYKKLTHRARSPQSPAHIRFVQETQEKVKAFEEKYSLKSD